MLDAPFLKYASFTGIYRKNGMLWFLFSSSCNFLDCCCWAILKGTCKYCNLSKFTRAFTEKVPKIRMYMPLSVTQSCVMWPVSLTNRKVILRKLSFLSQKTKEYNCPGPVFVTLFDWATVMVSPESRPSWAVPEGSWGEAVWCLAAHGGSTTTVGTFCVCLVVLWRSCIYSCNSESSCSNLNLQRRNAVDVNGIDKMIRIISSFLFPSRKWDVERWWVIKFICY